MGRKAKPPLNTFIGQEAELEQIAELLNTPGCRLLTLTGPGGVGKTRLAPAAGRQAVVCFPDGVWFVPLKDVHAEAGAGLHGRPGDGHRQGHGHLVFRPGSPPNAVAARLAPQRDPSVPGRVRQFAAEKLASGTTPVELRHSAYYLAFVGRRTPALPGNEPQAASAEVEA